MKPHPIRVYADTSIFGGVFDEEFEKPSRIFFSQVNSGKFKLVTSIVVLREIEAAPENVRRFFRKMTANVEVSGITEEAIRLQREYIRAGILPAKWSDDALHVALATVSGCGVIASWNFKHIVNFRKIALYNGVNGKYGFSTVSIHSPLEMIEDNEE